VKKLAIFTNYFYPPPPPIGVYKMFSPIHPFTQNSPILQNNILSF